jgi:tetratricopeptide (TPR) repeat protein
MQMGLGLTLSLEDRSPEAVTLLEESVRTFRELGDDHWEMQTSTRLARAYESLGDLERAREIHRDNVRRARVSGEVYIEARSLALLGQYELEAGRVEAAIPLLVEAQQIHSGRRAPIHRYQESILLYRFARALALRGEGAAAIRLQSCADAAFEELEIGGLEPEPWIIRMNERTREMVSPTIDEATAAAAREDGRKLAIDQASAQALDLLRQR